jgi:hypothetical protein
MLLGHSIPQDWTYAIDGGVFTTASADLHNRNPGDKTRVLLPGAATITITATRDTPIVPRVGALLGLVGVPAGTRASIAGKAVDGSVIDLGGNSATQRTAMLPDGSISIWWVFDDGLPACVGYALTLYSDGALGTAIPGGAVLDIGEINIATAVCLPHEPGWTQTRQNTATVARTLGGAVARVSRPHWRKMSIRPAWADHAYARGAALAGGLSYESLLARLAGDPFVMLIEAPDLGADLIQSSGLFGVVTNMPSIQSLAGPLYQYEQFEFEEVPS